ncbi:uroporphyrinogen-III synthase [Psychrobacter fozii]|uniref:Uroporphyrinogen-III synthase n=1 Tax=Psychrobacter fozii TaxID=198480 RepID=A0A2V4UPV9_9GAMM|nr:uroporphyrinogen-III synthase [Psychrobacter fozii]PYE41079.1 uroporphyrinogen-III synthase [Psychrobacter fozii]
MSSSIYAKSVHKGQATDAHLLLPQVVINTRPVERSAPLTQHLQAEGLSVVEMPMLALQSRPTTNDDMILMQQWLAGAYKALVIVSPTAAAAGLAVWQMLKRENQVRDDENDQVDAPVKAPSHIIAVGEATAAVLSNRLAHELEYQVRQPEVANNEGMLAMPEIESLQAGDKLLVWRGLGGRRLLVDALQARGVHVDSIAWYERKMPVEASVQYEQWLQGFLTSCSETDVALSEQPKPIVVVSSGAAFEHWEAVVSAVAEKRLEPTADTVLPPLELADFAYVVLGERLANMVAEQQLYYWRVEDLAPETILAAIRSKH